MASQLVVKRAHRCGSTSDFDRIMAIAVTETVRVRPKIEGDAGVNAVGEVSFQGWVVSINSIGMVLAVRIEFWIEMIEAR